MFFNLYIHNLFSCFYILSWYRKFLTFTYLALQVFLWLTGLPRNLKLEIKGCGKSKINHFDFIIAFTDDEGLYSKIPMGYSLQVHVIYSLNDLPENIFWFYFAQVACYIIIYTDSSLSAVFLKILTQFQASAKLKDEVHMSIAI